MQKTSTGTLIILFFAVAIAVVACGDNGSAKEAKMIKEMTGKEWDELLENDPEKFGRLMKKANEMGRKQREKEKEIVRKKWKKRGSNGKWTNKTPCVNTRASVSERPLMRPLNQGPFSPV